MDKDECSAELSLSQELYLYWKDSYLTKRAHSSHVVSLHHKSLSVCILFSDLVLYSSTDCFLFFFLSICLLEHLLETRIYLCCVFLVLLDLLHNQYISERLSYPSTKPLPLFQIEVNRLLQQIF